MIRFWKYSEDVDKGFADEQDVENESKRGVVCDSRDFD